MGWLKLWWRQSDHYDELSSHLQSRGVATFTRMTIAVITAGLAVDALATIWTPTGPRGVVQLACTLAAFAGAAIGAVLWALSWPTRVVAIRFAVLSNASIALIALAQSDPIVAMLICTTFATMASYIALFHPAPLLAYNFAIATVIGGIEAVRIAQRFGFLGALCGFSVVLLLNLAVPFGIQTVVHILGTDAVRADRDQLTGLLNRHAFHRRAKACLTRGHDQLAHFVITVIDLDRFKQLNDNYGHSTGDDALASVARALRDTSDDTAVIGRTGGEEFVIADRWRPDQVDRKARQICDVIAALPFGITASIGTASVHPASRPGDRPDFLLIELIAAADAAMYVAKRRGGNQVGHHRWPTPPRHDNDGFEEDETDYRSDGISA
jgi:diguanylate cyclase (GGDEF)-like protein